METVLIIGSSRGIGRELTQQYLDAGWNVHATTRDGTVPKGLDIKENRPAMHALDVRDQTQIDALVEGLAAHPIDVLIVAAGISDQTGGPGSLQRSAIPEADVFAVNAEAPMNIAEAVFPNLTAADKGRMIFLSSLGGSRSRGRLTTAYQRSKAALNDRVRAFANAWRLNGVVGLALHPGWVATDMGGARGRVTPSASAKGIRRMANRMGPEHNGGFFDYQGMVLPW